MYNSYIVYQLFVYGIAPPDGFWSRAVPVISKAIKQLNHCAGNFKAGGTHYELHAMKTYLINNCEEMHSKIFSKII